MDLKAIDLIGVDRSPTQVRNGQLWQRRLVEQPVLLGGVDLKAINLTRVATPPTKLGDRDDQRSWIEEEWPLQARMEP